MGSSSTCIVSTPFITLFCLDAVKDSMNSHLAVRELPKDVLPIAFPEGRCLKDLVIVPDSFR